MSIRESNVILTFERPPQNQKQKFQREFFEWQKRSNTEYKTYSVMI